MRSFSQPWTRRQRGGACGAPNAGGRRRDVGLRRATTRPGVRPGVLPGALPGTRSDTSAGARGSPRRSRSRPRSRPSPRPNPRPGPRPSPSTSARRARAAPAAPWSTVFCHLGCFEGQVAHMHPGQGATAQAHQRRSQPGVRDLHQPSRNGMGPCPKLRVECNAGALDGSARRPHVVSVHDVRGAHAERSLGRAAEACFRACTEARVTPHHHQMAPNIVPSVAASSSSSSGDCARRSLHARCYG